MLQKLLRVLHSSGVQFEGSRGIGELEKLEVGLRGGLHEFPQEDFGEVWMVLVTWGALEGSEVFTRRVPEDPGRFQSVLEVKFERVPFDR